jgi:hypothetical protein
MHCREYLPALHVKPAPIGVNGYLAAFGRAAAFRRA